MNKWQPPETAPRCGKTFLGNFGYPWPVVTRWDESVARWSYAEPVSGISHDDEQEEYFENEWADIEDLKQWTPLPEIEK